MYFPLSTYKYMRHVYGNQNVAADLWNTLRRKIIHYFRFPINVWHMDLPLNYMHCEFIPLYIYIYLSVCGWKPRRELPPTTKTVTAFKGPRNPQNPIIFCISPIEKLIREKTLGCKNRHCQLRRPPRCFLFFPVQIFSQTGHRQWEGTAAVFII